MLCRGFSIRCAPNDLTFFGIVHTLHDWTSGFTVTFCLFFPEFEVLHFAHGGGLVSPTPMRFIILTLGICLLTSLAGPRSGYTPLVL